jgi:hypothetical protein
MSDLAQRIRDHVDAAPPVTLDEVTGLAPQRRRSHRGVLVATVMVACAAAWTLARIDRADQQHVTVGNSGLPAECHSGVGCPMQPAEASKFLGFEVRLPTDLPTSWVQARQTLRQYDAGTKGGDPDRDVRMFRLLWAPPGTRLDSDGAVLGACPALLQVDQRPARPGESAQSHAVDVGNGRSVNGNISPATCESSAPSGVFALLDWTEDGVWYRVHAWRMEREEVLRVVRSLQR